MDIVGEAQKIVNDRVCPKDPYGQNIHAWLRVGLPPNDLTMICSYCHVRYDYTLKRRN